MLSNLFSNLNKIINIYFSFSFSLLKNLNLNIGSGDMNRMFKKTEEERN